MNIDQKEKRLMEAFASYESGESLATLQTIFPDVAVELNQMVEAERMLKEGKLMMRPSQELGRKVVAALSERQRQNQASVFMSGFWRLAAPVGIAALSFMFVLVHQHTVSPEPTTGSDADVFAVQEVAPMMAKNAAVSLMAVAPEQGEDAPAAARMTEDGAVEAGSDAETDTLYRWQMITLGLLVFLSVITLWKHWLIRRNSL